MAMTAGLVEISTQKQIKASSGISRSVTLTTPSGNTKTVWVGGKSETTESGKGYPLPAGTTLTLTLQDVGTLWAISEEGTQKVYYLINGNTA